MMIGREPNTDWQIVPGAGPYDFREFPRCQFWNVAYGVVAESIGKSGYEIKQECVRKGSSPILFANSLPIGIKSFVANKQQQRSSVTAAVARQHVEDVFAIDDLVSRVRVVIMSGLTQLSAGDFTVTRDAVKKECQTRGIHVAQVPFFFGPNKPKIDAALTEKDRGKLGEVASAFLK
jgi:hypothetical protein